MTRRLRMANLLRYAFGSAGHYQRMAELAVILSGM